MQALSQRDKHLGRCSVPHDLQQPRGQSCYDKLVCPGSREMEQDPCYGLFEKGCWRHLLDFGIWSPQGIWEKPANMA